MTADELIAQIKKAYPTDADAAHRLRSLSWCRDAMQLGKREARLQMLAWTLFGAAVASFVRWWLS